MEDGTLDDLTLTEATADDSEFAYQTRKVAFYKRLGFTPIGETDTHIRMEMVTESAAGSM